MDRPDRMEKWLCVRCTSKQKCRFINNFALNAMIYSLLCVVHSWNSNIRTCVISASICFPTLHIALGENRFPNDIIRPCMPAVRNNLCKIQIITGNYLFSHAISSNLFFHAHSLILCFSNNIHRHMYAYFLHAHATNWLHAYWTEFCLLHCVFMKSMQRKLWIITTFMEHSAKRLMDFVDASTLIV